MKTIKEVYALRSPHYRVLKEIVDSGEYKIDTKNGIVYSKANNKQIGQVLNGYPVIEFSYAGMKFKYRKHFVIAVAANWDIEGKKVLHKNGDIYDNRLENLYIQ